MKKAVQQLDSIIYDIIHQHRLDGNKNDVLTMLLEARDGDSSSDQRLAGMSDKQLRDEAMTLFLAGHETTAIALSWTWYLLSQHPEVEAKLLTELNSVLGGRSPKVADLTQLKYTRWVINESLRLYPPAWMIGRQSLNECEIGGYQIPVGSIILMSQWVMHHDPRYFREPDYFNPDRWISGFIKSIPRYAYFPFGGGPRQCIGSSFALMEATLVLVTIAQQFSL